MLQAQDLRKAYGAVQAVRGLTLTVGPGQIVGIVGNNGAGKTTTIKMLAGLLEPTSGTVRVGELDPMVAAVRSNIGFLPEDSPLYEDMTPLGYLRYFGALYGLDKKTSKERGERLLQRLRLFEEHWKKPIQSLSKGSARKVAIARCLLHDPAVVILDEPRSGLDPATQHVLDTFLLELRAEGKAIVLSAHDLDQVERICDHVVVVENGEIVLEGSVAQLRGEAGPTVYILRASLAFEGSEADGVEHIAQVPTWDEVEERIAQVRAAGGNVLDVSAESPRLADVLQRTVES